MRFRQFSEGAMEDTVRIIQKTWQHTASVFFQLKSDGKINF